MKPSNLPPEKQIWSEEYIIDKDVNGNLFYIQSSVPYYNPLCVEIMLDEFRQLNKFVEDIVEKHSALEVKLRADNYNDLIYIQWKSDKDPAIYKKELHNYNIRDQKYQEDLAKYKEDLKKWEKSEKGRRIAELERQLKRLKKS